MGSCQKSSCSGVWWWPLSAPALLHTQSRFPLELEWAQDSSAVLSPQDISVCTFSYPWGIKGGALLYSCSTCRNCSGSTVSHCSEPPWWGHRALPWSFSGWVQASPDLWLVWFSSFSHFAQNQWIPLAHGRRCRGWACSSSEASVLWMFLQPEKASKASPKPVMLSLNSVFHVLIPFPKLIFSWPIVKISSGKLQQVGVPCSVLRDWSVELC